MNIKFLIITCMLSFTVRISLTAQNLQKPEQLTISEGFKNPIGFYDVSPNFSWHLPAQPEVKGQSAYQIVVATNPQLLPNKADLWDSKKQNSSQSVWIDYAGKKLDSRQKVYWQVKFWNQENKASEWSEINNFELGLLKNTDWSAKWIGMPTSEEKVLGSQANKLHRPQYLRKVFESATNIKSARLYITAKGVFDIAINGIDVSDDVMPAGWTPYKKRIETITYDVTKLIKSGKNIIAAELAPGWHSSRLGWSKEFWKDSQDPKLLCQLELTLSDNSKKIIISDASWKGTTKGPIRLSEIYDGEIYDANFELTNWHESNFDDKTWKNVNVFDLDANVDLVPKRHSTVKAKIILPTKEVQKRDNGTVIFDLQQNMVGVPLLNVPVKKGDTLKIRFSEMLSPDGTFYTQNYRSAHSTDYYIASNDGVIKWQPKFTFHGFRYVEISGFDSSKGPTKDWVQGIVQYSDFEQNGSFVSSHDKLNQLQSNIVWGLRGNFFDIPTDCPQRDERMGWTGDAQVFAPTSMFNADVYSFWASWLQSVRNSQYDNGGIPFVVPDVLQNDKVSSGWGDVATIAPWEIYFKTGDKSILEENYKMMKAWVAHHQKTSNNFISHMNSFADWLQPFPENGKNQGDTDHGLIGTAFFAYSAKLTANAASVIGNKEEQKVYETLFKNVASAFNNNFFDENGKVKGVPETQTSYLLALAFDLLPEKNRQQALENLLIKIKETDNHLRTGFLGTPLLTRVLGKYGKAELMNKLLFNETYPSWFYSINQGATTIWERWNSYSKEEGYNQMKMNSLNHYAYGCIGEWMYEQMGGISAIEAGYKKIRIAPLILAPLTQATTSYKTPYGLVSSSWKIEADQFQLSAAVPPNTTAVIVVPSIKTKGITLNGKAIKDNSQVKIISIGNESVELLVKPGTYNFDSFIK